MLGGVGDALLENESLGASCLDVEQAVEAHRVIASPRCRGANGNTAVV
jgi:hypothetical protein